MKRIDTGEYVSVLKSLVEEGREVNIRIAGNSMAPFLIHERDYAWIKKPEQDPVKGDIVFYQRKDGRYILHRICRVKQEGYYLAGDAQNMLEGPIGREQIFAVVTKVRRKEKWIGPGDFWWEFFRKPWIRLLPIRRGVIGVYGFFRRRG